jgi:chromosomal replication initiation ATPase DnaA
VNREDFDMPSRRRDWSGIFARDSARFNVGQQAAWNRIKASLDGKAGAQRLFFLKGDGGTGKTYLYNAAIAYLRAQNKIALATVGC